jgi:anti-sigma28 factor (negative regulator of flagellin synthesis)
MGLQQPAGESGRQMRLNEIQQQVGRGEYQVDIHAVADAIVRRLLSEPKSSVASARGPQAQ